MDSERGLLEAILRNPNDMMPRLVYADWCDELGDPRGEFIRIQCELATYSASWIKEHRLREREAELFEEHRRAWNGAIHRRLAETPLANSVDSRRGLIRRWGYRRGFVEFAVVEAQAFLEFPEALFQIGPLRQLQVLRCETRIRDIVSSPFLPRLESVELDLPGVREDVAQHQIYVNRPPEADNVWISPLRCLSVPAEQWGNYRGYWEYIVNTLWKKR